MRIPILLLPGALLAAALPAAPGVALAQNARIVGKWVLNEEESEGPRAALQRNMRGAGGRGGMREGGRRPPGGRPSGSRGGQRGGGDRERVQQGMQGLIEASPALNIVQDDSTVTIVGAEGSRLILYPDGRKIEYPIEGAGNVETRAHWDDGRLVVVRKVERGPMATQTYERASEGRQLHVRVRLEGGPLPAPVEFLRVYDLQDEGG